MRYTSELAKVKVTRARDSRYHDATRYADGAVVEDRDGQLWVSYLDAWYPIASKLPKIDAVCEPRLVREIEAIV